jgi:hypothetical protein
MTTRVSAIAVLLLCASASAAFAQIETAINERRAGWEFEGSWAPISTEDMSNDPIPVDYTALPLNDEARARALNYSESQLSMIDHQCEGWSLTYTITGPFGMKVWSDFDPVKGDLVSYTIGAWEDKPLQVIWMDGRPHPSEYDRTTRSGFTTGRWEGQTLVTRTTHMKEGFIRKNGPPSSDRAVMTVRYQRHGNLIVAIAIIEDPVYLTEPVVWTRNYEVSSVQLSPVAPPCLQTFEGTTATEAPHFLWGRKPADFMEEHTKKYGTPRDAVLGYAETLYPEYRQKMKGAAR